MVSNQIWNFVFENRNQMLRQGRVHIVNIATLASGERWMLDVGFGGDGPTKPLPLISEHVTQNLGTQEVRLIHSTIPQQLEQSPKLWIYQYRNGKDKDWNSFYAFPEMEFFQADFEIMSFFTSQYMGSTNFQTSTVLIVRFLRGETKEEGIIGKVMLVNGGVKRNDGGKTRLVLTCMTEEERVKALEEHFDIRLTNEEVNGIKGRSTELLGKS
jgi:arylamine N-acetyltransferase